MNIVLFSTHKEMTSESCVNKRIVFNLSLLRMYICNRHELASISDFESLFSLLLGMSEHERLKTIRLFTQLSDVISLCVENNTIFTQLLVA